MELFGSADILTRFILALGLIVGLIALTAWLAKLSGLTPGLRWGRTPGARLQVVDSIAIDNTYKVVLVRRDQVEHLLCLGGPASFVVEQDIQLKKMFVPPEFRKKAGAANEEDDVS